MNRASLAQIIPILMLGLVCRGTPVSENGPGPDFSSKPVRVARGPATAGFTLINPHSTGVWFTNVLQGDPYLTNAVAHNGSGLALGDVDGDGWVDVYFCRLQGSNQLYRNLGNWHFELLSIGAAVCTNQFSTGAAFADIDGDGDLDLLVNGIAAGTRLFLNDGRGHFAEQPDSGLSRSASATSMALADIDGDGDLDLYCAHYIDVMHLNDPTIRFSIMNRNGRWVVLKVNDEPATLPRWRDRFEALPGGKVRELPEVHGFYRNQGHGHFTAMQFEKGFYNDAKGKPIPPFRDWGLSAMFRDLDGDGAPDLYVCNDNASPDRVWINSGRGTFRALGSMQIRHTSRSSMGIDMADVNRDGHDDIFVLDMIAREHERRMTQLVRDHSEPGEFEDIAAQPRYNRNMLFLKRSDGSYAEAGLMAGIAATDWSWCPIFLDVDLDGYEDLLVSNGFSFDVMDQDSSDQKRMQRMPREQLRRALGMHPSWITSNAALRNRGDGTFEPAARAWHFDLVGVSNGMAVGDLDNDGDLDVVINNLNSVASLLRNDASAPRIAVRLKGAPPNIEGIGARLTLVSGVLTQSQEMIAGGRYMSSDQPMRVFALPDASASGKLEVRWRNGDRSVITNLEANRIYEVDQRGASKPETPVLPSAPKPIFVDATEWLGHVHRDDAFDDWSRQPLLPDRLSRLGPGLCWGDLNGDGWEDLIVGSGRGGALTALINQNGTSFKPVVDPSISAVDQGAIVSWTSGRGSNLLLVATSNYELPPGEVAHIAAYRANALSKPEHWPAGEASPGPLCLADVDGDGDLDLFVGGQFHPGQYPAPVSSAVWLNDDGTLRPSPGWSAPFSHLGLVNGATFTDLDNDGWPDMALATDWGPVRLFHNEHVRFSEVTEPMGLSNFKGRWTGIAAGDFDGDGKLDLAAGNRGRNTALELYRPGPWRLWYTDWNGDGVFEIIEAAQRGSSWAPLRDRRVLAVGFPDLPSRFPTYKAFGTATVKDILGDPMAKAAFVEANYFESTVFFNRGTRFEVVPMPPEAQRTPVFGVTVADFDGDGTEDLFLSQNFFGTASDLSREDAGLGLWLRGTGQGVLSSVESTVSGIHIFGEQRGAAACDFNHDGRVDLAVSENNAETKLLINRGSTPGLRISLAGPTGNPDAVGAQVRVVYAGGRMGPTRAIRAGSGYWSQDAAVQVLGLRDPAVAVWVLWPGGKQETIPVPTDSLNVRLSSQP